MVTHDEDVLALEAGNIVESALQALADFTLVLVDDGQVQVTVAGLESLVDGLTDLTGGRLPGTETQLTVTLADWYQGCIGGNQTYGISAPELRVTFLPRDMVTVVTVAVVAAVVQ